MYRQEAIQYIKSNATQYLKPAKKKGYICPICGNGTGADGDGITSKDKIHYTCFKGCFSNSDIIDIIGLEYGISDFNSKLKKACEIYNIEAEADPDYTRSKNEVRENGKKEAQAVQVVHDYTEYIKKCKANLQASNEALTYLHNRGLTNDIISRFNVGYDPEYKQKYIDNLTQEIRENKPIKAIITPSNTQNTYFTVRELNGDKKLKPIAEEAGEQPIFNLQALYNPDKKPVFVVEGQFCTMSIAQAGGQSIALNGTGYTKLIKAIEGRQDIPTLILCLDNDTAGTTAQKRLEKELQGLNIEYITHNIAGEHKDPNEHLQADAGAFYEAVREAEAHIIKPDNIKDYLNNVFIGDIQKFKTCKDIKTGFKQLDYLTGGLYSGLYVLGAIPSLGKTTFIHQMTDQLAGNGEHIIFFSLEQSRFELASKSIARITAQTDFKNAVNSLKIRSGEYTTDEAHTIYNALEEYKKAVKDRISIVEGNFNTTVKTIRNYTENYILKNKVKPIVIIDYLQIIQAEEEQKAKGREAIESIVTELKRISRDNDIIMIVISSLNRANYLTPVSYESFKETGGIEYTADVVMGLNLQVLSTELFDKENKIVEKRRKADEAKAEMPRKIELSIVKNRYGRTGIKTGFKYYPEFDLFIQDDTYNSESTQKREQI